MAMAKKRRLQFNFRYDKSEMFMHQYIAQAEGLSPTDVLRQLIRAKYKHLRDAQLAQAARLSAPKGVKEKNG